KYLARRAIGERDADRRRCRRVARHAPSHGLRASRRTVLSTRHPVVSGRVCPKRGHRAGIDTVEFVRQAGLAEKPSRLLDDYELRLVAPIENDIRELDATPESPHHVVCPAPQLIEIRGLIYPERSMLDLSHSRFSFLVCGVPRAAPERLRSRPR